MDRTMVRLSSLVPMISVRRVQTSIDFYRKLGFVEHDTHTPEGGFEPVWAWLDAGGAHLMLALASEPVEGAKLGVLLYVFCDDVAELRRALVERGVDAGPIQFPFYAPKGEFRVTDPDGYVVMVTHTG